MRSSWDAGGARRLGHRPTPETDWRGPAAGWQEEVRELLAYGRRIGLGFDAAWREALACVEVPAQAQGGRGQRRLDAGETVLEFFERMCRRVWDGERVAPDGWAEATPVDGGVAGHGLSREPPI